MGDEPGQGQLQEHGAAQGVARPARRHRLAVITLLNPHVYLDTVVLLGTMASPYPTWGRAAFATGGALASALWFTAIGFGARWLAPLFASPQAWRVLDGVTAACMMALAIAMALS